MTIVGIDTGGTNLKMYCKVDEKVYSEHVPTGETFTREIFLNCVQLFISKLPERPDAVGIAYSGIGSDTRIRKTNRTYLVNLDVSELSFLNCPVVFLNDSNAATLAGTLEYPDAKVLVGVTNGTGIGAGICINGHLFTGANGYAGEINSNYFGTSGDAIHAGKLCSGLYLNQTLKDVSSEEARQIIAKAAENFGLLLTHVINLVNPDVIYLAGGTFRYENYFDTVVKTVKEKGIDFMVENLKIACATNEPYTGCLGAIQYAKQKCF